MFADIGFRIGELAENTDTRDSFGALWLPVKMLSVQGEQACQHMIVDSCVVCSSSSRTVKRCVMCPACGVSGDPRCKFIALHGGGATRIFTSARKRVTCPCEDLFQDAVSLDIWTFVLSIGACVAPTSVPV